MEPLDPVGTIIIALSVVVLFLLVLGLPLFRGINTKKNLKRHGVLATVGLSLQTVSILFAMVPALPKISEEITIATTYAINHGYILSWVQMLSSQGLFTQGCGLQFPPQK
jgi:hypothetical protein